MSKNVGLVEITGELLAECLGLEPGHVVTHFIASDKRLNAPLCIRIEGPSMPLVGEGGEIPWVEISAR